MSVRVMTAAWSIDLPAGDKLVLLALADCANDEGHCWPGIRSLCKKTGKSERSLQSALNALEEGGQITRNQVPGKGCNYVIHPRNNCAPAETAPPQKTTQTPAKSAGKPSRTISSEAKASSPRELAKQNPFPKPDGVDPQVWSDFLVNRKKKRLSNHASAHKRLMTDLNRYSGGEWTIPKLLEHAAAMGWAGIYDPRPQSTAPPGRRADPPDYFEYLQSQKAAR